MRFECTLAGAIQYEGLAVIREPFQSAEMGGALIALANDPDGYVLEFIQRPKNETAEA